MMTSTQLEWMQALHQIRTPFLDGLMRFYNYLDRSEFYLLLIPIIWVMINWKAGIKFFYLISLSHLFNQFLKMAFSLPRPFHIEPSLAVLEVGGFGFPSGAAQNGFLLASLLILHWKSRFRWPVALFYFFSIAFSRIYLGVHFFTDILGGWAAGALLLAFYLKIFPPIISWLKKRSPFQTFAVSQIPLQLLVLLYPYPIFVEICSSAFGFGLGILLMEKAGPKLIACHKFLGSLARLSVVLVGIVIIEFAGRMAHIQSAPTLYLHYASIGLWISYLSIPLQSKVASGFLK